MSLDAAAFNEKNRRPNETVVPIDIGGYGVFPSAVSRSGDVWILVDYAINVLAGIDVILNAILGGKRWQTLSCRLGISIEADGWASRLAWPRSWVEHFRISAREDEMWRRMTGR